MLATKGAFLSGPFETAVPTGAERDLPASGVNVKAARESWPNVIDYKLIEWGRDPSQLEDEGTVTPTKGTIQLARAVAQAMSKDSRPEPTRVVPDAHGGIVFEREEGLTFESVRVSANGSIEYCVFHDGRLIEREPWG